MIPIGSQGTLRLCTKSVKSLPWKRARTARAGGMASTATALTRGKRPALGVYRTPKAGHSTALWGELAAGA
jgi:hypothetical protein